MHERVSLNGEIMMAAEARLAAAGGAILHGRGVFTTAAVHRGQPFLWEAHWARLTEHARRAGVEHSFTEDDVTNALHQLLEANKVVRGRVRVTLLARAAGGPWRTAKAEDESEGRAADSSASRAADLLLMTGDARRAEGETLALTVSPHRLNTLSPLAGVKSTSYLEHLLTWEEARSRDFDEAVVMNERGEVASASMANLFWVRHGTVHTPALATGAMAGTTRARVVGLAKEMAVPVVEGTHTLHELAEAEEIFLTSAGLGLRLVTTFDFHRYTVPVGSVALRLHEAFRQLTLGAM
jgi:branched-subunit amino acid aminotransferase/4-amino-4-deoxychorismate lyase